MTVFHSILDGLVSECLASIPQYSEVYPAPRPDVSKSLEQMIIKGFPQNKKIVWHKTTHGQKRYYWIMKPNGNDEVRVKVGGGGVVGKAGKYLCLNLTLTKFSTMCNPLFTFSHQ